MAKRKIMKMLMVVFIQRKRFYIEISVRAFFNNFVSRISRCYLDKVDSAIRVYLEIFIELIKKKKNYSILYISCHLHFKTMLSWTWVKTWWKFRCVRFYTTCWTNMQTETHTWFCLNRLTSSSQFAQSFLNFSKALRGAAHYLL